ncbi:MAG: DUF4270 family protein [Saprospiraceae bacterium]|nr:DUF4270 family protein [Saprospiraceae bacterium]MBK7913300.1 DUF4270 family protein [Saprospiraceae bacterium]
MTGKLSRGFMLLSGVWILLTSCNEIDPFGSDLLNSAWIDAKGIDTFHIQAGPADPDSIISYRVMSTLGLSGFQDISFPLGVMNDPLFGKVEAGFGSQLRIIASKNLDFLTSTVDSVVISLRYDTSTFYGYNATPATVRVYPLSQPYSTSSTYYSNYLPGYDKSNVLGELKDFIPNKKDSLSILEDTFKLQLYPQLRFRLDSGAFMKILRSFADTIYFTTDSFSKSFNGIAVVCESGDGIMSVLPQHADSKITVYYHYSTDTVQSKREFYMSSFAAKTPFYKIDNQATVAANCLNGSILGDSLLCMQGFTGRDIRLKIPYDSAWKGKFINYAVLHLTVDDQPGDDRTNFPLPKLLEVFDISSGTKVAIDDVALGLNTTTTYTRIFGGNPISTVQDGKTVYSYKMNITRHFQKSLKAKKDLDLVISPLFKLESAGRLFFKGPGATQNPAKLILTYSE